MKPTPHKSDDAFLPRLVAWEATTACNLHCLHCRAGKGRAEKELTTVEAEALSFLPCAGAEEDPLHQTVDDEMNASHDVLMPAFVWKIKNVLQMGAVRD